MDEQPDKRKINGSYQWDHGERYRRGSDERIQRLENKVNGVDKAEGRVEVGQATLQEQIAALKALCHTIDRDIIDNHNQIELQRDRIDDTLTATSHKFEESLAATNKKSDYALSASNKKFEEALAATNTKFEDALKVTNKKFDDALIATNIKFDENRNYFTRYFIIILVTIITGIIIGGAAFILNRG
jgi:uncharacterized phage infection (PIP) family protein YhgE